MSHACTMCMDLMMRGRICSFSLIDGPGPICGHMSPGLAFSLICYKLKLLSVTYVLSRTDFVLYLLTEPGEKKEGLEKADILAAHPYVLCTSMMWMRA
jgi:hypothetical protein